MYFQSRLLRRAPRGRERAVPPRRGWRPSRSGWPRPACGEVGASRRVERHLAAVEERRVAGHVGRAAEAHVLGEEGAALAGEDERPLAPADRGRERVLRPVDRDRARAGHDDDLVRPVGAHPPARDQVDRDLQAVGLDEVVEGDLVRVRERRRLLRRRLRHGGRLLHVEGLLEPLLGRHGGQRQARRRRVAAGEDRAHGDEGHGEREDRATHGVSPDASWGCGVHTGISDGCQGAL
jgi:hypothetical protein